MYLFSTLKALLTKEGPGLKEPWKHGRHSDLGCRMRVLDELRAVAPGSLRADTATGNIGEPSLAVA